MLRFVLLCAVLPGCFFGGPSPEDAKCPDGGTTLRYADFGQRFVDRWCQSCHGSEANDRQGAPGNYVFDDADQVRRHRERILLRAGLDDSMPPGPEDPPAAERAKLTEWLACGAP